jgi:hypothetical protein
MTADYVHDVLQRKRRYHARREVTLFKYLDTSLVKGHIYMITRPCRTLSHHMHDAVQILSSMSR